MSEHKARPLVLIGAGGHARELLDIVDAVNERAPTFELLGFLDDQEGGSLTLPGRTLEFLGPVEKLRDLDTEFALGIGSPAARRHVDGRALEAGRRPATLLHPTASFGSHNRLGEGLVAAAGVRVTTNVELGRHVHLNLNATVSHDCEVDDYAIVGPGANLAGNVTIGEEAWIGIGASIIEGIKVGPRTTVGAGAVVVSDLPEGVTAVGVPARPLE